MLISRILAVLAAVGPIAHVASPQPFTRQWTTFVTPAVFALTIAVELGFQSFRAAILEIAALVVALVYAARLPPETQPAPGPGPTASASAVPVPTATATATALPTQTRPTPGPRPPSTKTEATATATASAIAAALLATLASCAPQPPQAPCACSGRLRSDGRDMFLTSPPNRYWRGAYLYVLAHDPPGEGSTSHARLGIVQVTEPRDGKVAWYCRPDKPVDAYLAADGLPVEDYAPDSTMRVGKCWGHFAKHDEASWKPDAKVTLRIDLGPGDKVEPNKDRFVLLGDPILDWESRTVVEFERIGVCTALPLPEGPLVNECVLDLSASPKKFTRQHWVRGGSVHLLQGDL